MAMTVRDRILEVAAGKIGNYGKGSPEVEAIWREVLDDTVSDAAIKDFAKHNEWCGGFVLSCLRQAGVTDAHWKIGQGFVLNTLTARAAIKQPQPGDIGIRQGTAPHLVYHHFFVERYNGPEDWDSIDGNSPFCARHHHTSLDPTTIFYSIATLLPAEEPLPEAGFLRGQKFSVPGIQDGELPPKVV
jgi:hypothetical protein